MAILTTTLLIIPFGLAATIYKDNFGNRYETYAPMARNIDEFVGLNVQRHRFTSDQGQVLVGYKYYKSIEKNNKGIVVISHGLGGGGQNSYMDVADFFASNGYVVFAYDATGNDESEGSSIKGLPEGVIDLDYALRFVKETSDFDDLPIVLFGHSWGGYAAGSVLNLHPDVKAVVMVAGFNKSMDIIEEEGKKIGMSVLLPYISFYERIKLEKYASYNCIDGFENTGAGVMIIHSADDEMISQEKAFDVFYAPYKNNSRFNFVKYENRGHDYIYYSDRSHEYREAFNRSFDEYLNSLDEDFTIELKSFYLNDNLDKKQLFDLDEELMNNILKFYENNI